MSKPFDEAVKLKGICRFCLVRSSGLDFAKYSCQRADLGEFTDFCTKEDYLRCTFNNVNMKSYPQKIPLPAGGHAIEKELLEKIPAPAIDHRTGKPVYSHAYIDGLKTLEFKNAGQLKEYCLKNLNMQPSQIDMVTKSYDLTQPGPRKLAWLDVVQRYEKWLKETK